jgi:hypothetical protein
MKNYCLCYLCIRLWIMLFIDRITEIKKKKINSSELKLQLNDNYSLDGCEF